MIYDIRDTEEALAFGKTATKKQMMEIKKARRIYDAQYKLIRKSNSPLDKKTTNWLLVIATRIQLCNETLAAKAKKTYDTCETCKHERVPRCTKNKEFITLSDWCSAHENYKN